MKIRSAYLSGVLFVLFILAGLFFSSNEVFAADSGGGGTGGGYTNVNCDTATHIKNTQQCDGETGGASWHMFDVNYPPVGYWNRNQPYYTTDYKFLSYGGYGWNFYCPKSHYDYYLAYVYDGWNGEKRANAITYYGPLQWGVFHDTNDDGTVNHYPVYHSKNSFSYGFIVNFLQAGNSGHRVRISGSNPSSTSDSSFVSGDALAFYQKYCAVHWGSSCYSATSIPQIGWFCIPITMYYNPKSGESFIDIKVNDSDGPLYFKPGDTPTFSTVYKPGAQTGYNVEAQNINVNGTGITPGGYGPKRKLRELFPSWDNKFDVTASFTDYGRVGGNSGTKGNTSWLYDSNNHLIAKNEVGESSPTEIAAMTSNTPHWYYSRSYYDYYILADINTGRSDKVTAFVPYNFINTTSITTPENNDDGTPNVAYAGETKEFDFDVTTNLRENKVTNSTYATIVRNVHTRLELCYKGVCKYSNPKRINDLHINEDIYSSSKISDAIKINIPDIEAGGEVCIRAGIYPKDSYNDTNTKMDRYNINDNNSWFYSGRKCYTVAKKPSIQTWGGDVYTQGKVETSTAIKNNLEGYDNAKYNINIDESNGTFVFGSWNELGVVANNGIIGFGSGASMGYAGNDGIQNGVFSPWPMYKYESNGKTASYRGKGNLPIINGRAPGGSEEKSYCNRVPLTIPNAGCKEGGIGVSGSSMQSLSKASDDKQSIVDILGGSATTVDNGTTINQERIGLVNGSETKLFQSEGDIIIDSDLIYFDSGSEYKSYKDMPKLVIYADNIKINCNVERIDALLIAKRAVLTCNNLGNDVDLSNTEKVNEAIERTKNNEENSTQLFVNGAIIANRLIANRTYGAATGPNSIISAEIINFDPTLYKFNVSASDDNDVAGRLDISSIQEVSPRL